MKQLDLTVYSSAIGEIAIFSAGGKVCGIDFDVDHGLARESLTRRFGDIPIRRNDDLPEIRERFERYFRGDWGAFEDIGLDPGGTEFQQIVWNRLQAIPVGQTRSYTEVAQEIGRPGAIRAVGGANARNPIPIIIPCHRVIGKNSDLRGYAGGMEGVWRQKWLLKHEGVRLS